MPNEWYTSPRGAEERFAELKKLGFNVKRIKKVMIKVKNKHDEPTWLVSWTGRAKFKQTTF